MSADGRLMGIARHDRPRGPMETLDQVAVTTGAGVQGDFRGAVRPGKRPRRQISVMESESWEQALADLQRADDPDLPWWKRRANLLTAGVRLPREKGRIIAIGDSLQIEVTGECDPCSRMEEIASGLKAALMPDWRGGIVGTVIADGEIRIGDEVRIIE